MSKSRADIIYIAFNTAHYFYDELSKIIRTEIINVPKITFYNISKNFMQNKIVLLATQGTYVSRIYEKYS